MVFVSVTRLRLRSWRYLPVLYFYSFRSLRQAAAADGILAVTVFRGKANTFWTRTVWQSEMAMRSYMLSGAHARSMPSLLKWCDEASVVHWLQEDPRAPSWEEGFRRMQQEGRPSKLRYPSPAHRAYQIATPTLGAGRELRYI